MKKLSLLLLLAFGGLIAQNDFQQEFYTADLIMKYRSDIELTEAQKTSIKKIHGDYSSEFSSTKWDLEAEMVALNGLLSESSVDESKSLAQMKKVTDLENKMKMTKMEMLIKIKNTLTASQQEKLRDLRGTKEFKNINLTTSINDNQRIKLQVGKAVGDGPNPLYIIKDKKGDKEVTSGYMKNINPKRIESIEVLKGESAEKAYGYKGKDGVIVIKMKKNKI